MKILWRYAALLVLLCTLSLVCPMYAQSAAGEQDAETKNSVARIPFFNRFSFKTNAVDWLAVLPNFGVEFQITDNPYKYMTVGLSAKWNWSSYHGTTNGRYSPPAVYDIFDIRPEFRYYYRTIPKPKTKVDLAKESRQKAKDNLDSLKIKIQKVTDPGRQKMYEEWIASAERELAFRDSVLKSSRRAFGEWLKDDVWTFERKNPRTWRAHYIGAYASYANYAFKFGERGIRGRNTFGVGVSAGYVLPLYEYDRGAIDIDLGLSVGVQMAKHDVFTHNMDGNFYTRVTEGKTWYGTQCSSNRLMPYPVVSELRVAFVWRKQSIKYEAKMDEATIKKKRDFEKVDKMLKAELDKVMPLDYKTTFDDNNKEYLRKWRQVDTLYRDKYAEAVASQKEDMLKQVEGMTGAWETKQVEKLRMEVQKRENAMMSAFDRLRAQEKREAAKKAKKAEAEAKNTEAKKTAEKKNTEKKKKE